MAAKVTVRLEDDLDGSTGDDVTTVDFGVDGVDYQIELGAANAERLRRCLAPYVESATRLTGPEHGGASARSGLSRARLDRRGVAIRRWARDNGHELADLGRIPRKVVEAYQEAVGTDDHQRRRTS